MNRSNFTASLHTHVRSLFDAHIQPSALCRKIKEMGGKGCAITDHGVLSSIEDYRTVFKNEDLKMIPGCELYVDGGILGRLHLVVLAVNDRGYRGICKIVTEANKNLVGEYPVITEESLFTIMKSFQGDIIALSGCMQGVISAIFLQNKVVTDKVSKLQNKQGKYLSPDSEEMKAAKRNLESAKEELIKATLLRDEVKAAAEQKFSKREKVVAKLEASKDPEAVNARTELEADKVKAEAAKNSLPKVKEEVDKAKKRLSSTQKEYDSVSASVENYLAYEGQIKELEKELQSDESLMQMAEKKALQYQETFGIGNFYAEVQYHGIPEEAECFPKIAELAAKVGLPLVATNDVHILDNSSDERLKRQIMRSMRFGKEFEQESVGDDQLYLKDNSELAEMLLKILPAEAVESSINNIDEIFDRCCVTFETGKHYPKFSQEKNADDLLDEEIQKGIKWRFPNGMDEEHEKRLAYELPIIKKMGYADYHLIVKDFLEYGRLLGYVPVERLEEAPLTIESLKAFIKENDWKNGGYVIGPGRGSAVGSLVCYLLGITALDPLKYGLLFERFLNPERISMPDIDSDISNTTRDKVIRYVQNKYGEMAVCGIMTTNAQAPKGAIQMTAKYYGFKKDGTSMYSLGRTIAKHVPEVVNVSFSTMVTKTGEVAAKDDKNAITLKEYLLDLFKANPDASEIIRWSCIVEGMFTAYGAHAAGIVISDNDDVSEYLPLKMNTGLGMYTTQCDMVQVEENGLLKFDFLGLKTLDIITETFRLVEKNYGIIVDPYSINLDDQRVYQDIFSAGKTNSVFQFESNGMKNLLKRFCPTCFEDLIILVSMYRPGPMQYLDEVISVKNGKKPMTFMCPELEPILGKTYGAIVYQEQVMEICQKLAGFTLGHADMVRRFMSKKKVDKLAHEREAFVNGCVERGIDEKIASVLFDQMEEFAKYAFNKSHAAVYAFNAFITAWQKLYYPAEFFTSALNWATTEKIRKLMYDAANFGVKVNAPDVNLSEKKFSVKNGEIRFGLSSIAGVKDHADEILEKRESGNFVSLKDFLTRTNCNDTVYDHLISAGAMDSFGKNREAMKQMVTEIKPLSKTKKEKMSFIKSAEYVLPVVEKLSDEELKAYQESAGLKAEIKESTTIDKLQKRIDNAKTSLDGIQKAIDDIRIHDLPESKTRRMTLEKTYLGMYVTEHPMDFYPSAKELGIPFVDSVPVGDGKIYGVITNLEFKNRKSDGARMAFFTIEDKSGTMQVCTFTKAFSLYEDLIKEGNVVILSGHCDAEEREVNNDQEEGQEVEVEYKFITEKVETVSEKKSTYMLPVSSYAVFHMEIEKEFRLTYEDPSGHPFLIFDKSMDEMREMKYCVSENLRLLPNVEEVF